MVTFIRRRVGTLFERAHILTHIASFFMRLILDLGLRLQMVNRNSWLICSSGNDLDAAHIFSSLNITGLLRWVFLLEIDIC